MREFRYLKDSGENGNHLHSSRQERVKLGLHQSSPNEGLEGVVPPFFLQESTEHREVALLQSNAAQHILEARLGAQVVPFWFDLQKHHAHISLFVTLFQPG